MENIHAARKHSIMYFANYVNDWSQCNTAMEAARRALRCASCDAGNKFLIDDASKTIKIKQSSINALIKACYNMHMYQNVALKELYTAYLNYAKHIDNSIMINSSALDAMFNTKVIDCGIWTKFTGSTMQDDLTRSRECIQFGISLLEETMGQTKNLTFTEGYYRYIKEIFSTLSNYHTNNEIVQLIPKVMRPSSMGRILPQYDPHQQELLKLEEQADRGFVVDIKDISVNWKFIVPINPNIGVYLDWYVKDIGLATFNFGELLKEKNIAEDIQKITEESRATYKQVFGTALNK